jgi:hypothetical protein
MASTFIHPVRSGSAGAPTVFNLADRGPFFEPASPEGCDVVGSCASIIDDDELLIAHGGASATDTHLLAMARDRRPELLAYIEHRRSQMMAAITDPFVVVAGGAQRLPKKYRDRAGRQ